jgi:hypothetical protein
MPFDAKEAIRTVGMERILADLIEELDGDEDYVVQLRNDLHDALDAYKRRHDNEET